MRRICISLCVAWAFFPNGSTPADERVDELGEVSFWRAPKVHLEKGSLAPASVRLIAGPDTSRGLALLQVGNEIPLTNYVPGNQRLRPFVATEDTGYQVIAGGLKVGAVPFGDRKYTIPTLDPMFSGLTLLKTKMWHKSNVDGRYSMILSAAEPCYVFVALDERALVTYQKYGTPSWMQEYRPTGHKLMTDEPLKVDSGTGYVVFVRQAAAGRIVLGPPGMDADQNSMYFAFFAAIK